MEKTALAKLVQSLHPLELKVLPHLGDSKTLAGLKERSGLKEVEVLRALQWLQNKKALVIQEEIHHAVRIEKNGLQYAKQGLPEHRFLAAIQKVPLQRGVLANKAQLTPEELSACIGLLRNKQAITFDGDRVSITPTGKKVLATIVLHGALLQRISRAPTDMTTLSKDEQSIVDDLKMRKDIIRIYVMKSINIRLTDIGQKLASMKITVRDVIDAITPEMLREGTWKGKTYRRFDVSAPVPKITCGKRHFVREAMEYAKSIWLDLGFREMTGPLVHTSFWNFDALFTAQDHPVREIQDTFFVRNPENGKLPAATLVESVKTAHEHGNATGSTGWRYSWSPEEAKRNVLRTHTTVLSARTLYALRDAQLPVKYFALGRCFRNEALDWSHLFEFNQTEGIVIDEHANFRHLLGYLKEFFRKMGFEKARFRPAYFPYTEPSVEIDVYHPVHEKWIELGGAGMFRPEVVIPLLGKDVPVLAWGPGFDRIIMDFYKIADIRDLYRNDLKQLREMKAWIH